MVIPNAADVFVSTAAEAGIKVCFANPGTSEMHLAGALERSPAIKTVLCLHENVATGAADGWARMTGNPAMTLLHLGPGLANGLANLHNARRASSPLLNVVGDMTSWLKPADPLLGSDVAGLAHTVSKQVHVASQPGSLAQDVRACIDATAVADTVAGSRVVTLVVPHDLSWQPCKGPAEPPRHPNPIYQGPLQSAFLDDCAKAIAQSGPTCMLLLGGGALHGAALMAAGRIAATTGAVLVAENAFARADRGVGRPLLQRLPYFPDAAAATLHRATTLVVVGTRLPVPMFGYRDGPQSLVSQSEDALWELDVPTMSPTAALEHIAARLDTGPPTTAPPAPPTPPAPMMPADGALTPSAMCAVLVRRQPADAILVDESITSGTAYWDISHAAPPFTHLTLTGGAIGIGPPLALGAALAAPARHVINLQADGSAAYTLQALWSQAREHARVLTIVCVNNAYHILRVEQHKQGVSGCHGALTDLTKPRIDWVAMAAGFGVPGVAAGTVAELDAAIVRALAMDGPFLIAAQLP